MTNNFEDEARRRPKGRSLGPLARLTPFLWRVRGRVAVALIALLVAASATLIVPIAARRVIDNGFTAANATLVDRYFVAMLVIVAALAAGSAIRFYFVMWLGERVVADIRDALFSHLLDLSPGFYETQKTGEGSRAHRRHHPDRRPSHRRPRLPTQSGDVWGAMIMMVATSPKLGSGLLAIPLVVLLVVYGRRVRLSRLPRIRWPILPPSPGTAFGGHDGAIQSAGPPARLRPATHRLLPPPPTAHGSAPCSPRDHLVGAIVGLCGPAPAR
jgi:ATP-binding cassette subfamily B protein